MARVDNGVGNGTGGSSGMNSRVGGGCGGWWESVMVYEASVGSSIQESIGVVPGDVVYIEMATLSASIVVIELITFSICQHCQPLDCSSDHSGSGSGGISCIVKYIGSI